MSRAAGIVSSLSLLLAVAAGVVARAASGGGNSAAVAAALGVLIMALAVLAGTVALGRLWQRATLGSVEDARRELEPLAVVSADGVIGSAVLCLSEGAVLLMSPGPASQVLRERAASSLVEVEIVGFDDATYWATEVRLRFRGDETWTLVLAGWRYSTRGAMARRAATLEERLLSAAAPTERP